MKAVTVTLNPAVDMTGTLDKISSGKVNLIDSASVNPGGKGINVAKVLAELGANVTVTGFLGDENQATFVQLFSQLGINDAFVRVAGASRINVKLVEQDQRVTDLNFPGVSVTDKHIAALESVIFTLASSHDFFILAGSLPQGFSLEKLSDWIKRLKSQGKKVIFDSSNQALTAGIAAAPWLIKPNDEELSQWAGVPLKTQAALLMTGRTLAATGIENIVISRGAEGVLWLKDGQWLQSQPPKMQVVSTVGAGDTLVAGMCWGTLNNWPSEQVLSFATALSALAVTQVSVGVANLDDVLELKRQVVVNRIAN